MTDDIKTDDSRETGSEESESNQAKGHSQSEGTSPPSLKGARMLGLGCVAAAALLVGSATLFKDDSGNWFGETADPVVQPAPVIAVAPEETELAPYRTEINAKFNRGDTLMNVLTSAGAERGEAHLAIKAMSKLFSPRQIKAGQELFVVLEEGVTGENHLAELSLKADKIRSIRVLRETDGSYKADSVEIELTKELVRAQGTIDSSLYQAAVENKVPLQVLADMINIFSFDVDFQREVQREDSFALMFERMRDDQGNALDYGEVLLAEMILSGEKRRFYRFKDKDGFVDYYDEKGRSVRKALLKTPIDGARISSRYGKRKHPILGYTKQHSGVDFAAPRGTPIYAAGNGTVEVAGRNGSYGIYIRLRHTGSYKTAYAHLSKLAKGMRKGKRVRQRQVIGYVGTTGRSTGPHLHFEVHKSGRKVNPLSVKLPTGKTLKGKALASFQAERARIENQYAELPSETQLAKAPKEE